MTGRREPASETVWNDTWGEITRDELAAMRANARPCVRCGMLATVDPAAHAERYAHAPRYYDRDRGQLVEWAGAGWEPVTDESG